MYLHYIGYIYIYTYVYMYVYIYICMYLYMYIYICIYAWIDICAKDSKWKAWAPSEALRFRSCPEPKEALKLAQLLEHKAGAPGNS